MAASWRKAAPLMRPVSADSNNVQREDVQRLLRFPAAEASGGAVPLPLDSRNGSRAEIMIVWTEGEEVGYLGAQPPHPCADSRAGFRLHFQPLATTLKSPPLT